MTAYTLILLRHGESDWNQKNLFTGWVDVDLTEKGRAEAVRGGELMLEAGLLPDVVHTSVLRRAITTANIALDTCDRHWIPVRRSWRLNERHYGALQGLDKAATREKYGDEQFMLWRRSFDTPPPPIPVGSDFDQTGDPRYAGTEVPLTECLADVIPRMMPYWQNDIRADLIEGHTVLVTAHGNSMRALVKHLDGISDEDIAGLNIPTGMPLVYRLGSDFMPTGPSESLDPEGGGLAGVPDGNHRGRPSLGGHDLGHRVRALVGPPHLDAGGSGRHDEVTGEPDAHVRDALDDGLVRVGGEDHLGWTQDDRASLRASVVGDGDGAEDSPLGRRRAQGHHSSVAVRCRDRRGVEDAPADGGVGDHLGTQPRGGDAGDTLDEGVDHPRERGRSDVDDLPAEPQGVGGRRRGR